MRLKHLGVTVASVMIFMLEGITLFAGSLTPIAVSIDDSTAGKETIYTFNFITSINGNGTDKGIPDSGKIRFIFPPGFDMGQVSIAHSKDGSINGGFSSIDINGQQVEITRDGTGDSVLSSTAVSISIGNVTNITTTGDNFTVDIITMNNSGTSIDQGTTRNFSIIPGAISYIKINDQAGSSGNEIGTLSLTADESIMIYAAGYDANGNYFGAVSVNWSVTGGIGNVSSNPGTFTTFYADTVGKGAVIANDGSGHSDATGEITVSAGALTAIKIVQGSSGEGVEFGTKAMTTDQTLTLHAAGYDGDGNYRGDETVDWSVVDNPIGSVNPTNGTSTTFDATKVGTGRILAHHAVGDDYTGTITVNVGVLGSIKINDQAGSSGNEIGTLSLTADESITMYAAGYDADGNYFGAVTVNWSVTGGIGNVSSNSGTFTTFYADTVGKGAVTADDGSGHSDATGEITVSAGALTAIKIVQGSSGEGVEFGTKTMTTDQTLTLHAAGYDGDGNYRGDETVDWSVVDNPIGSVNPTNGTSTAFDATKVGTGRILAHHAVGDDYTGTITVNVGALNSIKIIAGESGDGPEYTTNIIQAGQAFRIHAAGYDADDNYSGDPAVNWSIINGIGTVEPVANSSYTDFTGTTAGKGLIRAIHGTAGDDYTDEITVNPGPIHHLTIRTGSNEAGKVMGDTIMFVNESLTLYAAGYDLYDNFVHDVEATWDTTSLSNGQASTLDFSVPIVETNIIFNPQTSGTSGRFYADSSGVLPDTTGNIIVGDINYIKINTAPGEQGIELDDYIMSADDSITLYAAAYDSMNNYLDTVSVAWSVETFDSAIVDTGASFIFSPIIAPDTVKIFAHHFTIGYDSTDTILVIPGTPAGFFTIIPDSSELSANDSDSTTLTSSTIFDSDSNQIAEGELFTISISPSSLGITITTPDANNNPADGHQVASDNSGKISFVIRAGGKGGTAFISASSVKGSAYADTSIILSALRIISIETDRDKVSQGQDSVEVRMLVENSGPQSVSSISTDLKFIGAGGEPRRIYYDVFWDSLNVINVGQQLLYFKVDIADAAPAELVAIDGTINGLAGGVTAVQDTSANQTANWLVQQPPQLNILTVSAPKDTVEQGTSTSIYMTVQNTGGADAVVYSDSIIFSLDSPPFTDVTNEYSQIPVPSNPDTIKAIGPPVTLSFNITVGANASEGVIKLDGNLACKDINSDSVISKANATTTDLWVVKKKGEISVIDFFASQQYITMGQITPWWVTMRVQNNFDTTTVTLDSARVIFFAGTENITEEYSIIFPIIFEETGNDTLHADSTETLIFKIDTTGNTLGYIRIEGTVYLSDVAHTQRTATGEEQIIVQSPSDLLITDVTTSQPEVTIGQINDWKIKVIVRNTGASDIVIDFSSDSTYVKFSSGEDFKVVNPTNLEVAGDSLLASNIIDTLYFIVDTTGQTTGLSNISVQLAYLDVYALEDTLYVSNSDAQVIVESLPSIHILNTVNLAPNAPYINTDQDFQVRVDLQNTGEDGVHGVQVALSSDGNSIITAVDTFSIRGNDVDSIYFNIRADANWNLGEEFIAEIDTAIGDNTSEFDSLLIYSAVDDTVLARIQRPAEITILDVIPSQDTVEALSKNWQIFVAVRRDGAGWVQFDPPDKDSLKFYINDELQTDYYITAPSGFKNRDGLIFSGWNQIEDTLVYVVNQAGLLGGQADIQLTLTGKYLNNDSSFVVHGTGTIFVETTAALRIIATEPKCPHIEDGVGILSTEQLFKVRVTIANSGEEPVDSVWVSLTSNSLVNYPKLSVMLDSISAKAQAWINADITAQPIEERVEFIAQIDSAKSRLSGGPALIGASYDSIAVVQIQNKANLSVKINPADTVMTLGEISHIRFVVENSGTAKTDSSGMVTVNLPQDYRIIVGSDTNSLSATLSFITDRVDTLNILPPGFISENDQITISISSIPKDLNRDNLASVENPFATITVKTVPSNLSLTTQISWPEGATDDTLSTEQLFYVQAAFQVSENFRDVKTTLILPEEYSFDNGEDSTKVVMTDKVTWKLVAPSSEHSSPKWIKVEATGKIEGEEYTASDSISIITEKNAELRLENVGIIVPSQTDSTLSINQNITISATVFNYGDAGITGAGYLSIDFGATGITTQEDTLKSFTIGNPVIWEAKAPSVVTARNPIIVKIETIPDDENTNSRAYAPIDRRFFSVRTVEAGSVNIEAIRIISPTGALDRTLSTNQSFNVQAEINWNNCEALPTVSIELPDGFVTEVKDKNPVGTSNQGIVNWNINTPSEVASNKGIWVQAKAKDVNSGTIIEVVSDIITVQIVRQAEISLNAQIINPIDAVDGIVSTGQNFTIMANIVKSGDANIEDYYSVRLTLPQGQGYVTTDTLTQRVLFDQQVFWNITAPLTARDGKIFIIELIEPPHDENTNKAIDGEAIIEDLIPITIATEEKSINISVLPRTANYSLAVGDTSIAMLGLQFECSGDEASSKVLFRKVKVKLKDRNGNIITNPQEAISKISVVNYDEVSVKYGEVNEIPASKSIWINFTRVDTIYPSIPNKVKFLVDVANNATITDFQVTIDSSSFFDMIDASSERPPIFLLEGATIETLNVTSGFSVIVPRNFDKAFWNYPNPFGSTGRRTTTIQYYLDQDSNIELKIFTLLGELVWSRQYSENEPQGKKGLHDGASAIIWDARNNAGQTVLNGVYVAQLSTSYGKSVITKIAVLK